MIKKDENGSCTRINTYVEFCDVITKALRINLLHMEMSEVEETSSDDYIKKTKKQISRLQILVLNEKVLGHISLSSVCDE